MFQSRNRDAFRFKKSAHASDASVATCTLVSISESRCFSFQADWTRTRCHCLSCIDGHSFNLGIEMLFVSSHHEWLRQERVTSILVSISESRCFSFQASAKSRRHLARLKFQISDIELLFNSSYRGSRSMLTGSFTFQAWNRDAFHFNANGFGGCPRH